MERSFYSMAGWLPSYPPEDDPSSQAGCTTVSPHDRRVLRDFAKQVAEIAALPVMEERKELWRRHNRLERTRPLVLVFPERAWLEILPRANLQCETDRTRKMEQLLRSRILHHQLIHDDLPIVNEWRIDKIVTDTGWGIPSRLAPSHSTVGAWGFDPVLKSAADLKQLRFPQVSYDEAATLRELEEDQELLGDILDVRLRGITYVSFYLMTYFTIWHGLNETLTDFCMNPGFVHEGLHLLQQGNLEMVRQYEALNLLDVNNDATYQNSGGLGYSDELPKPGFDPRHIRPCDMWASSQAQELVTVSPEMHEEFSFQYERELLAPFGLTGYGCCEDLTYKLDYVLRFPNMRRISICPWADVSKCAERLQDKYIFSWKAHPAHLVGDFDANFVRSYLKKALDEAQDCIVEIHLKDTHTVENRVDRFTAWSDIARELVNEQA